MKYKIIELTWVDSSATRGWNYIPSLSGETNKTLTIKYIGYLISENKDCVCISTSLSHHGSTMDPLYIPKVAITKRRFRK